MRKDRLKWLQNDKCRNQNDTYYHNYKNSKRLFRKIHRNKCFEYMIRIYPEIDERAENNVKQFWNLVNRKRS